MGFSLVTAIFLLVVLSGLSAMMMTFFTAQQQSSTLDVMGTRAYQAAKAGIECGAYKVLQAGGTGVCSLPAGTLGGTLSSFAVNVTSASSVPVPADPAISAVYSLTSTATMGTAGQMDYVERQISVTITQ